MIKIATVMMVLCLLVVCSGVTAGMNNETVQKIQDKCLEKYHPPKHIGIPKNMPIIQPDYPSVDLTGLKALQSKWA